MLWLRRKHPRLTLKQARRRYYGADRISDDGVTLYNPAKMKVERYLFRGAQIGTPFDVDTVSTEVRFRFIPGTNVIESLNARYRRAVRARGHFPTEQAALKCLYLATRALVLQPHLG